MIKKQKESWMKIGKNINLKLGETEKEIFEMREAIINKISDLKT